MSMQGLRPREQDRYVSVSEDKGNTVGIVSNLENETDMSSYELDRVCEHKYKKVTNLSERG